MQAKWYLRAAEGGNVRAMYNVSLCYCLGEGFTQDHMRAKKWLQLAADCGHKKALYECGLKLCAVCHFLSCTTLGCCFVYLNYVHDNLKILVHFFKWFRFGGIL
jgi:hypothetical protein